MNKEYFVKVYSKNRENEKYVKFLITGGMELVKDRRNMSVGYDAKVLASMYAKATKPTDEVEEYDLENPVVVEVKITREDVSETDLDYYLEE